MPNNGVHIAYVVSPSFEKPLFYCLGSLLATGTTFDAVMVYCVGKKPRHWVFKDSRIKVVEVDPLMGDFFLVNKVYALDSDADTVVLLDADALVFRSLDYLWKNTEADFSARPASSYRAPTWNEAAWRQALRNTGAKQVVPYFNSGLVAFKNRSHKKIRDVWYELTLSGMRKEAFDPETIHQRRNAGQIALSLSVAKSGLSWRTLTEYDHFFAWAAANKALDLRSVTFYHTGSKNFAMVLNKLIALKVIDPSVANITK